jgi:antitoxin component HigA of HigAB toxin-antitoxin module
MEKQTLKSRSSGKASVPPAIAALPESYLALLGKFPLRPIRNNAEYRRASKLVHSLALREGSLDAGGEAFLEVLEGIVERYDREHSPISAGDISPTQVLRTLVEQSGMSVSELGAILGSKGAASELLSGKRREPSKAQIGKLCARFKVDAGLFLLPRAKPADAA